MESSDREMEAWCLAESEEREQREKATHKAGVVRLVRDRYNVPICIGSKVAFNFSGEIAIGYVVAIKPAKRYGKTEDWAGLPHYNFHIRHQYANEVSIVRSRTSVTVIK